MSACDSQKIIGHTYRFLGCNKSLIVVWRMLVSLYYETMGRSLRVVKYRLINTTDSHDHFTP